MTDKNDPPIEEREFIAGVRVVDIGDYRVSRGLSRRDKSSCGHYRMVYDEKERRVWCKDCECDVEGFDAFLLITTHFCNQTDKLKRREYDVEQAEKHNLINRAAKVIDKAWRKKRIVPCCPHCKEGLFPDDFKDGVTSMGKSYALEERRRKKEND